MNHVKGRFTESQKVSSNYTRDGEVTSTIYKVQLQRIGGKTTKTSVNAGVGRAEGGDGKERIRRISTGTIPLNVSIVYDRHVLIKLVLKRTTVNQ